MVDTMDNHEDKPSQPDVPVELSLMGARTDLEGKTEEEYNPFDHVTAAHPTTYAETFVHLFKGIVGTGILSLPIAFCQSGYVTGTIGVLLTTYFTTYSARILARSEVELSRRRKVPSLSYQSTTYEAFMEGPPAFNKLASYALHLCNILLLAAQIGSACAYIIFIACNVEEIADAYFGQTFSTREMVLFSFVPILLISLVRELKFLAPVSTLGSITVLGSCALLLWYMFTDIPPISSRRPFGTFSQLPQFFGIVFFATGCISLILPLQNEMRKPEQFTAPFGVLNVGSCSVAILYGVFGFAGYIKFGDDSKGSVTLNLPKDHMSAHIVQALLSLATLFSIPLCYYVIFIIIWENYWKESWKKNKVLCEYIIRVSIVIITVFIALVIPNLELVVSLTGVLSYCLLATIMPCIVHILTFASKYPTVKEKLLFFSQDIMVILLTSVIFVFGMSSNIERIVHLYT